MNHKWIARAFSVAMILIFIGLVNSLTLRSPLVGIVAMSGILALAGLGVLVFAIKVWR